MCANLIWCFHWWCAAVFWSCGKTALNLLFRSAAQNFVKLIFYVTSLSIFLLCLWKGSLMLGFSLNWVDWVNIRLTQYINFYVVLSFFFKFDWAEGGLTFAINLQTLCAPANQPEDDPSWREEVAGSHFPFLNIRNLTTRRCAAALPPKLVDRSYNE